MFWLRNKKIIFLVYTLNLRHRHTFVLHVPIIKYLQSHIIYLVAMATKKQTTEDIKNQYIDGSRSIYSKFRDQIQFLYSIMINLTT